jgi:DNA-binding IclR family transcriptional regulator
LVQARSSGITIPELADKMGIKQNYLYRVLPGLQKEGKVRKRGRTWYPKAA